MKEYSNDRDTVSIAAKTRRYSILLQPVEVKENTRSVEMNIEQMEGVLEVLEPENHFNKQKRDYCPIQQLQSAAKTIFLLKIETFKLK